MQNVELTAPRGSSTAIGEIDDLTLPDSIDGGVWLFDKTFQAFGKPVIPASLLAVAIHSLLDYDPLAIIGHDESVQIEENKAALVTTVPMGRLGLANAIVFVASDEASYITGHILNVDGGKTVN